MAMVKNVESGESIGESEQNVQQRMLSRSSSLTHSLTCLRKREKDERIVHNREEMSYLKCHSTSWGNTKALQGIQGSRSRRRSAKMEGVVLSSHFIFSSHLLYHTNFKRTECT